jgi:osmoprotectant transport system permease protein
VNLVQFLLRNHQELFNLILEHLFLVVIATGMAVVIGVPLGILLTRRPNLRKPVLGLANIMQTVPSLALFGFLIPVNLYLFQVRILGGIGARTAIVALVLYALLPIIRNTYTAINNVDPARREAARGMGMTDRQILFQVELPNAVFVILAGIRTALTINVGTVPLAFLIGAGGLGELIFTGIDLMEPGLLLAGAIPTALLAVLVDALIGQAQYWLVPRGVNPLR